MTLDPKGLEAAARAMVKATQDRHSEEWDLPGWDEVEQYQRDVFAADAKAAVSAYLGALDRSPEDRVLREVADVLQDVMSGRSQGSRLDARVYDASEHLEAVIASRSSLGALERPPEECADCERQTFEPYWLQDEPGALCVDCAVGRVQQDLDVESRQDPA